MIIKAEEITVEYETMKEKREHMDEMTEKGYTVLRSSVQLDFVMHEHIIVTYIIEREGYKGHPISEGSIK